MALSATTIKLDPTDWITAVRRPNGSISLCFTAAWEVEIPPELAASLFAGLISVMQPSAAVVDHPRRQVGAVRALFRDELPSDSQPPHERA